MLLHPDRLKKKSRTGFGVARIESFISTCQQHYNKYIFSSLLSSWQLQAGFFLQRFLYNQYLSIICRFCSSLAIRISNRSDYIQFVNKTQVISQHFPFGSTYAGTAKGLNAACLKLSLDLLDGVHSSKCCNIFHTFHTLLTGRWLFGSAAWRVNQFSYGEAMFPGLQGQTECTVQ